MQPKLLLVSILSLSLVIFGCTPAGEPAAAFDEDAIALEVKHASEASDAALIAGDVDTYLSYYMEDAVWLPPQAEEIVGKEVAKARLAGLFDELTVEGSSTIEEQTVMGPDWVSVRGQFNMALTPKGDEGETVYQVGSFVNTWKKEADGKWKIAVDIWNSDRGITAAAQALGK
jgi:uncharacterized protein (TIGR02246 family)